MKKWMIVIVTMLIVVFVFSAMTAAAGRPDPVGTFDCTVDLYWSVDVGHWTGTVSDCELAGNIEAFAVLEEYFLPGNTMHYVEIFDIYPTSGGEVHGKHYGVWNFSTWKFRDHGGITAASGQWSYLVGYKTLQIGTTTPEADEVWADDALMMFIPAGGRR